MQWAGLIPGDQMERNKQTNRTRMGLNSGKKKKNKKKLI